MFKQCSNCQFSEGVFDIRCHRYPPIPTTQFIGISKQKIVYEFPIIGADDVCGEWQKENKDWFYWPPKKT